MAKVAAQSTTADEAVGGVTGQGAADAQTEARTPLPVPEGGWPPDEFTGKGGDYVRDPYTGIRRPATV